METPQDIPFYSSKTYCLNRTMQYGNGRWRENSRGEIMFKSYYVVWKPIYGFLRRSPPKSLNRTMQYGNKNDDIYCHFPAYTFKSYYVVWKLYICFCI